VTSLTNSETKMTPSWTILGFIPLLITFNLIFFTIIEKKTKYKSNTQGDSTVTWALWVILLFGPIMFLFMKSIKRQRMHTYLKNRIRYLKWCDHGFVGTGYKGNDNMCTHRINEMERILKISMLYRQSKRNKIKKMLLLK